MATYTREQLTNMTNEEFKALSAEEQAQVLKQGKAFQYSE